MPECCAAREKCRYSETGADHFDRDGPIECFLEHPDPEPQPDPKPPSKQDVVIAMLRLPEGATIDEVASVTGWQRHTVRGVFSGTLKKKLGLTLASAKEERGRVYRIAEPTSL